MIGDHPELTNYMRQMDSAWMQQRAEEKEVDALYESKLGDIYERMEKIKGKHSRCQSVLSQFIAAVEDVAAILSEFEEH